MNGLLRLLFCIQILGAVLHGTQCETLTASDPQISQSTRTPEQDSSSESPAHLTSAVKASSTISGLISTAAPNTDSPPHRAHSTSPSPSPQHSTTTSTTTTTASSLLSFKRECVPVFMVSAGLIIGCAILLISTLVLACKVCQLSRRLRTLHSNADLISNSEYWMGTAKKNKSKPETEAKETSILMADLSQTQEDAGAAAAKKEGEKANEDGQTGEEENKKEVGDAAKGDEPSAGENKMETPAAVAENPPSSKQQEDTTDSQSTKAGAASSSEGTEEPK